MLKKFFLNFLSSFAGAWVALALFSAVCVLAVIAIMVKLSITNFSGSVGVTKHSVLQIDLKGEIIENDASGQIDFMNLMMSGEYEKPQSLNVLVKGIEEAADNKNIDVVYIKCDGAIASPATLHALREALMKFKKSAPAKKVIAYGDMLTQGDYYVASAADSIYLNPMGNLALTGIGGQTPFFTELLEKLGIQVQVAKVGTYKSAVEPFILTSMSEPARAQLDTLYGTMWGCVCNGIASARGIHPNVIDTLIDNDVPVFSNAEFAKKNKFVDALKYENEVNQQIAALTDNSKFDEVNVVDCFTLLGGTNWDQFHNDKNQIAVLYVSGDIQEERPEGINCMYIVPEIESLADDKNVKGLVLRVNSPGGSVFGSEQIWHALECFKKTGKPLAISMGDYAASGGYYISCGGDRIFADSLTITGSIGIFGILPNVKGLREKLGINVVSVSTNPNGIPGIPMDPLNEKQMAAFQKNVEQGYELFTSRVAAGRKMSQSAVKRIGEGRVWDAITAKRLGLVDELGSVSDAVAWTAEKAGIAEGYSVASYPLPEASFMQFLTESTMSEMTLRSDAQKKLLEAAFGNSIQGVSAEALGRIIFRKPAQARMPFMSVRL